MTINLYYSDDTLRAQALELAAIVPDAQVLRLIRHWLWMSYICC